MLRARRVGLSLLAVLLGWFAASCATLPLEVQELMRNAPAGRVLSDLTEGCGLWFGFTLLVACGVWLVLVLAIALLLPPGLVVRHRWAMGSIGVVLGVLVVADRLDFWNSLRHPGPESPFTSFVLQIYMGYAVIFAIVVTWTYAWLLTRAPTPNPGEHPGR